MEINEDNKSVTKTIDKLAASVVKYMTERGFTLSAAESCTGGLFSAAVTSVAGASAVFAGAAVTYTEKMKVQLLGVSQRTLDEHTVYSAQTACEMSRGVRELTGSDFGVGITGIAGPAGALADKPVGTVYIAVSGSCGEQSRELSLYKEYERLDRRIIRELAVLKTLELLSEILEINRT